MSTPQSEPLDDDGVRATACRTCPGRTLIVEEGNVDGWVVSDLVVDLDQYR
ncbi:hypothetical protein [Halomarina ordinaria]|uniref:Uncharacterized protein n=1 Tax=Halomarina ordinaria TaxID=3033939 RepID=A0ABD5U725_9EURY|nr:hypothetical protein [Halomarina sp. PSRA2]